LPIGTVPASVDADSLNLREHGARRVFSALDAAVLSDLEALSDAVELGSAGVRLGGISGLQTLLAPESAIGQIAADALGPDSFPVRAILFDKTVVANWSLGWHQDRTICVVRRLEVEGFGPWTVKHGLIHVAPPFSVLAGMVTLRIHLDAVPASNAPLLIAPGSHRLGRIAEAGMRDIVTRCGRVACLAERGDVWVYATPILHASEAARLPERRRVLQVDYARESLPGGLEWRGV
jgi:Phytanoyl-CoA dioxygenase (PhyH)